MRPPGPTSQTVASAPTGEGMAEERTNLNCFKNLMSNELKILRISARKPPLLRQETGYGRPRRGYQESMDDRHTFGSAGSNYSVYTDAGLDYSRAQSLVNILNTGPGPTSPKRVGSQTGSELRCHWNIHSTWNCLTKGVIHVIEGLYEVASASPSTI